MKKERNPVIEDIVREENKKQRYQNLKKQGQTIAQFQMKHCRYCKNKTTNLCEIRRDIDNNYRCEYEENIYERRNIK